MGRFAISNVLPANKAKLPIQRSFFSLFTILGVIKAAQKGLNV